MISRDPVAPLSARTQRKCVKERVVGVDLLVLKVRMNGTTDNLFHRFAAGHRALTEEAVLPFGDLCLYERLTTFAIQLAT